MNARTTATSRVRTLFVGFKLNELPFESRFTGASDAYEDQQAPVVPPGVEAVKWNSFPKKTLYDYNVIIMDVATLLESQFKATADKRKQLEEFMNAEEGGLLIIYSAKKDISSYDPDKYVRNYSFLPGTENYHSLPIQIESEPSEESRPKDQGLCSALIKYYKGQDFYFDEPLPKESKIYAVNRKGKPLSLEYNWGKGTVVLLPSLPRKSTLPYILDHAIPEYVGVAEPSWLSDYTFLDESELQGNLERMQSTLSDYRRWKRLLYATGNQLARSSKDAMMTLGLDVHEPKSAGDHDLEMILSSNEIAIIEITGSTGMVDVDKVRQLLDCMLKMEQEHPDLAVKGLLIANWEREKTPKSRGKAYTAKAVERAQANGICLITTVQLYELLQKFYRKEFSLSILVDQLRATAGLFESGT
jgi:hypothetical protein